MRKWLAAAPRRPSPRRSATILVRARRLAPAPVDIRTLHREVRTLAKTPRKWTGARSPSGLKRVRSSERRHAILGPRRATAKTLVKTALTAATAPSADVDPQVALIEAISALDRAAKVGAIHPNAAARRKSRLVRKVNAAGVGAGAAGSHVAKTIGKAAAQKAAKARIAASKADKAKGAQTAAGKARAALSKSARAEAAAAAAAKSPAAKTPVAKAATKTATKAAPKAAAKSAPKATAAKAASTKAAAKAPAAKKAPAKKAAKA
ncbi:MAG: 30S ribosomal protein S20 [Chloroflexota bacterium]|nr:MAG: 30S ribosomal protein S20 [Chloroflexota bacterium]